MKLATIVFLFLNLIQQPSGTRQSETGMLHCYVPTEQDVTRVARSRHEYFVESRLKNEVSYDPVRSNDWRMAAEGPVIRNHSFPSWNYQQLPMGNNARKERSYAVLPDSFSFPDAKKRLMETPLKRTGRKEHEREYYET